MSTNIASLGKKKCPFPSIAISSALPFSKLFHHEDEYKQISVEKNIWQYNCQKIKIESFIIHNLHMTQVLETYQIVNNIRKFQFLGVPVVAQWDKNPTAVAWVAAEV